jgi:transposase
MSKTRSECPEIEVQDIDHLGIVAGIVDEIGIVELINELIPSHELEKISAGQIVKAIILNCMSFITSPMYLFHQFFEGKATEHLLGEGVKAEFITPKRIGRVMDELYKYGLTKLFAQITLEVVKKFGIDVKIGHLDSTSISVQGEYLESEESGEVNDSESPNELGIPPEPEPVTITYGYSRDYRPDLKQFTTDLLVSQDCGIPLFMTIGSGNDSDTKSFLETLKAFQETWQGNALELVVMDSAFFSEENLKAIGSQKWISRAPHRIKAVNQLCQTLLPEKFSPSKINGYSFCEIPSAYGNVEHRWIIVESEQKKAADLKSLEEKINKKFQEDNRRLATLCHEDFACETDAQQAALKFEKTLKFHQLQTVNFEKIAHYSKPGRPAKHDVPSSYTYRIFTSLVLDDILILKLRRGCGRMILATNLPDEESYPPDYILQSYKEQQTCERGFRFLKDPLFFASRVFLKLPRRVMTLAFLMMLCLVVYSLGQRQLRQTLKACQGTVPDQKGKPTSRPTLRWIFQCFQAVHLIWLGGVKSQIKLKSRQLDVLPFLGNSIQKYYLLS